MYNIAVVVVVVVVVKINLIQFHYYGSNLRGGCLAGGVHVAFDCSHSRCSSIIGIDIVQVGYHC